MELHARCIYTQQLRRLLTLSFYRSTRFYFLQEYLEAVSRAQKDGSYRCECLLAFVTCISYFLYAKSNIANATPMLTCSAIRGLCPGKKSLPQFTSNPLELFELESRMGRYFDEWVRESKYLLMLCGAIECIYVQNPLAS